VCWGEEVSTGWSTNISSANVIWRLNASVNNDLWREKK
jgi:hypothetical protein